MNKPSTPRYDAVPIGRVAAPPFARLPDPLTIFAVRAGRLRALAEAHELAPYLRFLADLCECQHRVQEELPEPDMPEAVVLRRAHDFGMPPIDRSRFAMDATFEITLRRMLDLAAAIDMPRDARVALSRIRTANALASCLMIRDVLADTIPVEAIAEHAYVAAALQVHFVRLAARLETKSLVPVGDGICPCCGGAPVSSVVVGWEGAFGSRFCVCSLCATYWHVVRIKCTICGSTKGVAYQEVDGSDGSVKAEICDNCHAYLKIMQQHHNPALEPVADDVATLALDLLVRDGDYRRGAVNPFLLGY